MQRILQHAGQPARFFLIKFAGDNGIASVNRVANDRSGLDHAIENNCEPVSFVLLGDLAELLRAFAVELQLHGPAFVPEIGVRLAHTVASEVGLLFHKQAFHPRLLVFLRAQRVCLDAVLRRNHFLSRIDRAQAFPVIRINKAEFELGHARKLIARFLDLRGIEPRNLDENTIVADRTDDRLATAKIIDAFANDFDRLLEHRFGDILFSLHQADEKGSATLNIQAERDFLPPPI